MRPSLNKPKKFKCMHVTLARKIVKLRTSTGSPYKSSIWSFRPGWNIWSNFAVIFSFPRTTEKQLIWSVHNLPLKLMRLYIYIYVLV